MKGCQGTCVKDTWTKPKGSGTEGGRLGFVGRGEWWGENTDNYTWTSIKIFFKKADNDGGRLWTATHSRSSFFISLIQNLAFPCLMITVALAGTVVSMCIGVLCKDSLFANINWKGFQTCQLIQKLPVQGVKLSFFGPPTHLQRFLHSWYFPYFLINWACKHEFTWATWLQNYAPSQLHIKIKGRESSMNFIVH